MSEENQTLLIVEDDLGIAEMLNAYFRVQGYHVLVANWGEDGVQFCLNKLPDLVILDIRLPDIDGYEVARQIRANRRTAETPIIFLTEKRQRQDKLRGLALHVEDYITKPFDIQELRLRVRNALRRSGQSSLTNTVTGLPEGNLVDERLRESLQQNNWIMLVVSLRNLDQFRERYGFVASDDLLRAVCLILKDTLRETGNPNDFIGHLTPNNFVVVMSPTDADLYKERIQKRLETSLAYFYQDADRDTDLFKEKQLTVKIAEFLAPQNSTETLETLKSKLLILSR